MLAAGFFTSLAGQAVFFLAGQAVDEWYLAGLILIDFTVLSVFYGIIFEITFVIISELCSRQKPFGYDLSSSGQRFRTAEKGLATHLRLTVYFILLIPLGLYALNIHYIFNWVLYSRSAALLVLVFFFLPLLRLQARLRKAISAERSAVEKKLEMLYVSALSGAGRFSEEIGVLNAYRRFLLSSTFLPWRWDNLLVLTGSLLFLLTQPCFYRLFML